MCGLVGMWQRYTDGTLFKEEVAAEQGDDGAGLEEPEAEAVPLIGREAVELLAEEDARMELAEAAPADADETAPADARGGPQRTLNRQRVLPQHSREMSQQ